MPTMVPHKPHANKEIVQREIVERLGEKKKQELKTLETLHNTLHVTRQKDHVQIKSYSHSKSHKGLNLFLYLLKRLSVLFRPKVSRLLLNHRRYE